MNERERIELLMKCYDLSPSQFADRTGVQRASVSHIISGRNNSVTVSTLKKLCDGLDITIIDFFSADIFADLEQEIK